MAQPPQNVGDRFAVAPPGFSLTQDNSQWPWGRPPRDADPEIALENAVKSIERPKTQQEMIKLLMVGVSVEVLVEGIIFAGFQEGLFTPDVGMLIKPALAIIIGDMAEEENIPYRMFENDDAETEGEMDDETFFRMMKTNNPRMFEFVQENLNAAYRAGTQPPEPEQERGFLASRES